MLSAWFPSDGCRFAGRQNKPQIHSDWGSQEHLARCDGLCVFFILGFARFCSRPGELRAADAGQAPATARRRDEQGGRPRGVGPGQRMK